MAFWRSRRVVTHLFGATFGCLFHGGASAEQPDRRRTVMSRIRTVSGDHRSSRLPAYSDGSRTVGNSSSGPLFSAGALALDARSDRRLFRRGSCDPRSAHGARYATLFPALLSTRFYGPARDSRVRVFRSQVGRADPGSPGSPVRYKTRLLRNRGAGAV